MTERDALPFQLDVSEQANDDLARSPELREPAEGVLRRAAPELRRLLEMGQNVATDVHGHAEALTVRVGLFPPERVRIEQLAPGGPAPDDAITV